MGSDCESHKHDLGSPSSSQLPFRWMPKMSAAAICKGKWGGGETGVERDPGLRILTAFHFSLVQFTETGEQVDLVPEERLVQVRGPEAS